METIFKPHTLKDGKQSVPMSGNWKSRAEGGMDVIVAPPDPTACPLATYERVSLIAAYFKQHKPRSKIIVIDAKNTFVGQDLFEDAWNRYYPGMIEWLPAQFTGGVKAVEPGTLTLRTGKDRFKAAVVNVIPAHRAGDLARETGLADASSSCPVDPLTLKSRLHPTLPLLTTPLLRP